MKNLKFLAIFSIIIIFTVPSCDLIGGLFPANDTDIVTNNDNINPPPDENDPDICDNSICPASISVNLGDTVPLDITGVSPKAIRIYWQVKDGPGGGTWNPSGQDQVIENFTPGSIGIYHMEVSYVLAESNCSCDFTVNSIKKPGLPDFTMVNVNQGLEFKQGIDDSGYVSGWMYLGPEYGTAPATAKVSKAFEIGETEVTYELWSVVYDWAKVNGYTFANKGKKGYSLNGETTDQHPVTFVSWRDSIVWCNALTEYYNAQEGKSLDCVYVHKNTIIRNSTNATACDNAVQVKNSKGFRLPTTTEWGAAARWKGSDKSNGAYQWPPSSGDYWTPGDYASGATANCKNETASHLVAVNDNHIGTEPVKSRKANALGLYDMSGNVYEWNFEWHPISEEEDDYNARVLRGGSHELGSMDLQVGLWVYRSPEVKTNRIGFRIARTL